MGTKRGWKWGVTVGAAAIVAASLASAVWGQNYQPGDEVVVIRDTNLFVVGNKGEDVWAGLVLKVQDAQGKWLWVSNGKPGWLDRGDAIPLGRGAIDWLTEKIRTSDEKATWYGRRASVWQALGELDLALGDLSDAISRDSDEAAWYNNRGMVYSEKRDYDRAIDDYNEALRIDPSASRFNNRGNAYRAKGDYDRAIEDLNQALRIDPKYTSPYANRGLAKLGKKDYDGAIEDFDEALRLNPKFGYAYEGRGEAYFDKEDYEHAIEDFTRALAIDPKSAFAFAVRGAAYDLKGAYEQALADYGQALKLDPKDAVTWGNRGRAHFARAHYDRALEDYTQALKLAPDVQSYNSLAWFLATCPDARYRDATKAWELARKTCELTEWKNSAYLDTLAAAYAEAGDFLHAVEWQTKARDLASTAEHADYETRLRLYAANQPFRDVPQIPAATATASR